VAWLRYWPRVPAEGRSRKTGKLCLQSHPAWARRSKYAMSGMESAMNKINWDLLDVLMTWLATQGLA
jgi:hypothetical protein